MCAISSGIMTPDDMADLPDHGLIIPSRYYASFGTIQAAVLDPGSTHFMIDIEGSSHTAQEYEILVKHTLFG